MGIRGCTAQPEQSPFTKKLAASSRRGWFGAGNGTRTRDPELGRLALYQLSYSRSPLQAHYHTGGEGRIRTSEGISRQIYSLLPLATREPLLPRLSCRPSRWRESNSQPPDYKSGALPLSYIGKRRLRRKSYSAARRLSSERAFEGLLLASRRPLRALRLPVADYRRTQDSAARDASCAWRRARRRRCSRGDN